jgi:prefoldin subunit 5
LFLIVFGLADNSLLEKIKELESNEEVLFDEIEELSNVRCTLELSTGAKVQEVEELKTLLDDKNETCRCIEAENKMLHSKISAMDSSICELKT